MDQGSLVSQQIEAAGRFLRQFEKSTSVVVAFWLKECEEGQWTFYIGCAPVDRRHLELAYREIFRIVAEMNDPSFEPFQVRLLGLQDPMAQAAIEVYQGRPPRTPVRLSGGTFGGVDVAEVYLVKGPTGESTMASGTEVLHQIIDQEANFFQQHGKPPRKMKLPVLMAYDLAKCGRQELGDLSGRVFKDGITVFEKEGIHGMSVEIVRDRNARLDFE